MITDVLCPQLAVHITTVKSDLLQDLGTLKVSGYLRGKSLSVNNLIQLPNCGVYQMCKVCICMHTVRVWLLQYL